MKIIDWEVLGLSKPIIKIIDKHDFNYTKVIKKPLDYNNTIGKNYYNDVLGLIKNHNAISENPQKINITEKEDKLLKEKFNDIQKVLNSIEAIKSVNIIVDNTNMFILSITNMIAAFFTFVLRNYTGNWEIDMNIFFLVNFFLFLFLYCFCFVLHCF
jgi:hypothetical protein